MLKIRQALGEIPIVDDEIRKATQHADSEASTAPLNDNTVTMSSSRLVTADGTYATQSVFSAGVLSVKKEDRPPLRK